MHAICLRVRHVLDNVHSETQIGSVGLSFGLRFVLELRVGDVETMRLDRCVAGPVVFIRMGNTMADIPLGSVSRVLSCACTRHLRPRVTGKLILKIGGIWGVDGSVDVLTNVI